MENRISSVYSQRDLDSFIQIHLIPLLSFFYTDDRTDTFLVTSKTTQQTPTDTPHS